MEARGEARAGPAELARLGVRLGGGWLRGGGKVDAGGEVCRWARELMERDGARGLRVEVAGRAVHVVGDPGHSERVLSADPAGEGAAVSPLKGEAMAFLAPGALTIASGRRWATLRELNERVLGTGGLHPMAGRMLPGVRGAFEAPVRDVEDVRAAMGRAMVAVVLGPVPPGADPAGDVTALFGVVGRPLRRRALGFLYGRRRSRLYDLLERRWAATLPGEATLLGRARAEAPAATRDEVLQQVPHWMFTFTGSGTDLLARTLALVGSRPAARRRLLEELAAAGPPHRVETLAHLPFMDACLLEAGRLFPPVTRAVHHGATPLVHWFPLLQRDDALGDDVHDFRPERWLDGRPDAAAGASNLFLRGPRACPGRDLVLFVCRTALARQVGELGVVARDPSRLAADPLPVSFPRGAARFTTGDTPWTP